MEEFFRFPAEKIIVTRVSADMGVVSEAEVKLEYLEEDAFDIMEDHFAAQKQHWFSLTHNGRKIIGQGHIIGLVCTIDGDGMMTAEATIFFTKHAN